MGQFLPQASTHSLKAAEEVVGHYAMHVANVPPGHFLVGGGGTGPSGQFLPQESTQSYQALFGLDGHLAMHVAQVPPGHLPDGGGGVGPPE